jgi:hypothetical protein
LRVSPTEETYLQALVIANRLLLPPGRLKSHFLGDEMAEIQQQQGIPTRLSCEQFRQFVLPHLTVGRRGPAPKLTLLAIFNYILRLLSLGCQWKELPIEKDQECSRALSRCLT